MYSVEEFICELKKNEKFRLIIDSFIAEWGNNAPFTVLFSECGKFIADNFACLSRYEISQQLLLVEKGMTCGDILLKAYISTGLLEALYKRSQKLLNWNVLSEYLGVVSKQYLYDWISS